MERLPGSAAAGRAYVMKYVQRRVSEREVERAADSLAKNGSISEDDAPRDFLNLALDAEQDSEKAMTKYNVVMVGIANVLAGSDTTAISLSSILWHLTSTPRAMQRLRAEVDKAIQEGKMTADNITFRESQVMPYLQACIKEGLRMCAATGLPLWREVPKGSGGVNVLGHHFPEGTELGLNTWVAHYDEDVWGSDASHFRPERWIESDAEKLRLMDSYFVPFGLGSRTCIGRHISMLEISKVIPMIVSKFELELVQRTDKFETKNYFLVMPENFRVVVRARSQ